MTTTGSGPTVLARKWRVLALLLPVAAGAAGQGEPDAERQRALVRVVRQDCGACHGMRLTGGLGPALTPQALADKPYEGLLATVVHGRPGTPMPGWRTMLSAADAAWIVQRLQQGFPEEPSKDRP